MILPLLLVPLLVQLFLLKVAPQLLLVLLLRLPRQLLVGLLMMPARLLVWLLLPWYCRRRAALPKLVLPQLLHAGWRVALSPQLQCLQEQEHLLIRWPLARRWLNLARLLP